MSGERLRRIAAQMKQMHDASDAATVVCYASGERFDPGRHECVTHTLIAQQLAALQGYDFGGQYAAERSYDRPLYVVPSATIVGRAAADALGIRSERDLFGGVVPHDFVGTKSITHPLPDDRARAPGGWSARFPEQVKEAVLEGYSAFGIDDAQRAGEKLLAHGKVRVKPGCAVGGRGQTTVANAEELRAALDQLDAALLATHGLVVEQNLVEVTTYSVGQVSVGEQLVTYCGTQMLTTNNAGAEVYGGSDLLVARGDFDALLALDLAADAREAVRQARLYDETARKCFPGFFASRRNYDTVTGYDDTGRRRGGVLEQSWRIGGASGAEVCALELFAMDASALAARARCVEVYGGNGSVPADATIYFDGVDRDVGRITKYTEVEAYVHARQPHRNRR